MISGTTRRSSARITFSRHPCANAVHVALEAAGRHIARVAEGEVAAGEPSVGMPVARLNQPASIKPARAAAEIQRNQMPGFMVPMFRKARVSGRKDFVKSSGARPQKLPRPPPRPLDPILLPAPAPIIGVPAGEVGAAVSDGKAPERLVVIAPPPPVPSEAQAVSNRAEVPTTINPKPRQTLARRRRRRRRRRAGENIKDRLTLFASLRATGRRKTKTPRRLAGEDPGATRGERRRERAPAG